MSHNFISEVFAATGGDPNKLTPGERRIFVATLVFLVLTPLAVVVLLLSVG